MDNVCDLSSTGILALSVRVLTFFFSLALLPYGIVPGLVRLALALAVLFLLLPQAMFNHCSLYAVLNGQLVTPTWHVIFAEIATGLFLGVTLGLVGYVVTLVGQWLQLLGGGNRGSGRTGIIQFARNEPDRSPVAVVLALFLLVVLTSNSKVAQLLVMVPAMNFVIDSTDPITTGKFAPLIVTLGVEIFRLGLFLFLPFMILCVTIDAMALVMRRFMQSLVQADLIQSTKMPLIMLLLAMLLYPFSDRLAQAFISSTTRLEQYARTVSPSKHPKQSGMSTDSKMNRFENNGE